jgi:uncharacterized protein YfaS (alpha-2-macroglobulin family)
MKYLESVGKLTPETEKTILHYISKGYQNILQIIQKDGSFSFWSSSENSDQSSSNVWLTAYISKLLILAKNYIKNEDKTLIKALDYLKKQQQKEGGFIENNSVIYGDDAEKSQSEYCVGSSSNFYNNAMFS